MSNVVGSLVVNLTAHTAQMVQGLRQGGDAAKKMVVGISGDFRGLANQLGSSIGGPAGSLIGVLTSPQGMAVAGLSLAIEEVFRLGKAYEETVRESQKMNLSVRELWQLQWAAKKGAVDISTVETAMHNLNRTIAESVGDAQSVFAGLKLEPLELGKMSQVGVLEAVALAVDAIKNSMDRTRVETKLFGRSGAELDLVLRNLAKGGLKQYEDRLISVNAQEGLSMLPGGGLGAMLEKEWNESVGTLTKGGARLVAFWKEAFTGGNMQSNWVDACKDVDKYIQSHKPPKIPNVEADIAESFVEGNKRGIDDALKDWEKFFEKLTHTIESLDPLAAFQARVKELLSMKEWLGAGLYEKGIAAAQKEALGKLIKESPAMKAPEGPERYSAEAYRTIVDIQTGRMDKQLAEAQKQTSVLEGIRINTETHYYPKTIGAPP